MQFYDYWLKFNSFWLFIGKIYKNMCLSVCFLCFVSCSYLQIDIDRVYYMHRIVDALHMPCNIDFMIWEKWLKLIEQRKWVNFTG